MRMDFGELSSTKPSTVLTSRTVTVVPGIRSWITTRPFSSVMNSPLLLPTTAPLLSVTRKVTPFSGVVVPSIYFSITRVVLGVLVKCSVWVSLGLTTTVWVRLASSMV